VSNKATLDRLHHALNSGDPALVSTTVDEIFHPDVRTGTPLPMEARGAQALKQVWTTPPTPRSGDTTTTRMETP
jgi:hypothetical protein